MKLIFFRHGIAENKKLSDTDRDDFLRNLTKEGKSETEMVVKKCKRLLKDVDVIYSSPLSRAVETAEIIFKKHKKAKFEILSSLDSFATADDFLNDLENMETEKTYCFVGHEPNLTKYIAAVLNSAASNIALEKSGIVILEGDQLKITTVISPKSVAKLQNR